MPTPSAIGTIAAHEHSQRGTVGATIGRPATVYTVFPYLSAEFVIVTLWTTNGRRYFRIHRPGRYLNFAFCILHIKIPNLAVGGLVFALPIFPGSRPPSIVGVHVLNFCVRDGNRWTHMTINTNSMDGFQPSFISKPFDCDIHYPNESPAQRVSFGSDER